MSAVDRKEIIMNFSIPPSGEDITIIAQESLETLPEEIQEFCDSLTITVEEFPDEAIEQELDLEDPYDLVALFRSGKQISPGVEKKSANDDDILILFRRPLLDLWCETCDNLNVLVRQAMIEELGQNFEFSEDEIEEMSKRHFQGML